MIQLPLSVRALASRMKTRASLHVSHEHHDLGSLSQRIMLSPGETLDVVAEGKLLALGDRINGRFAFSSHALDALRSETVQLIAGTICHELSRRGADEDTMLRACSRAFQRQTDLSRQEQAIEFADPNDDTFTGGAKRGAGMVAGAAAAGAAGYLGYKYLKNRRKGGTPQLPGAGGNDGLADAIDVTPKPKSPSGGGYVDAMNPQHPAAPGTPRLTNGSPLPNATDDALGGAVRRGRQAIAKRGSAVWKALRSIPFE